VRLGFFSDVHANLEALNAVLKDFSRQNVERSFFLGDAVGYGADPNPCVKKICEATKVRLLGNHDYAALGQIETSQFNQYARLSIEWTKEVLTAESIQLLSGFTVQEETDNFHLVHATPKNPLEWEYLLDLDDAEENFNYFSKQVCLIGHSHKPLIVRKHKEEHAALFPENAVVLEPDSRYIINIGSVGQPRDGNPKACYLLYDTDSREARLVRVAYDVAAAQKKMKALDLPEYLIERISAGR
jgi:diadenosine tetraphosphatase ApaH/serine/threonine PP2A family protein phosphatase